MGINKTIIYLCSQITKTDYDEPIQLSVNIMPSSEDANIETQGLKKIQYLKIKQSINKDLLKIKYNDRIYYKKNLPLVHDRTQTKQDSANFYVMADPVITKNTIEIKLKSILNR